MIKQTLLSLAVAGTVFGIDFDKVDKAFNELDCEFKDCTEKPKVIIKKEAVPVIIYKEKVVEKPVEKVIYKEKVVEKPVEKIIYKDRIVEKEVVRETPAPVQKVTSGEAYSFEINPTITKQWYENDMDAEKIKPYTKDMKVNSNGWIVNKGNKSHINFNFNNLEAFKAEIVVHNIWNYGKSQIITFMNDKGDTCGLKAYDYSGKGMRYYRSFGLKTDKNTGRKGEFTVTIVKQKGSTAKFLVDGQRLDLIPSSKKGWNLASLNITDLNLKSIKVEEYK